MNVHPQCPLAQALYVGHANAFADTGVCSSLLPRPIVMRGRATLMKPPQSIAQAVKKPVGDKQDT